jgi:hypothetical protein
VISKGAKDWIAGQACHMEEDQLMAHVLYKHFFSWNTLVRVAFTALSLGYGVQQAHAANAKAPPQSGNQYNWLAGGGG